MDLQHFIESMNTDFMNKNDLNQLLSNCAEIIDYQNNYTINLKFIGSMPGLFKPYWIILYNMIFDIFFVGCILLAGITGNVLSCFVLAHDRSHGTTSFILTCLAIFDTLFLIFCLFFQFLRTLSFYIVWLTYINLYAHISKILYGSGMAVRMMRNWTVVLVSLERWVAVCRPLHAPSICTRKKAHITMTLIIILSFIYNIPHFLIVDAMPLLCFNNTNNLQFINQTNLLLSVNETYSIDLLTNTTKQKGVIVYHSAIRSWVNNNYSFRLFYRLISYMILIVILPNVIIAIFNVLLIRGIQYANKRRAEIVARLDCANKQIEKCNLQKFRQQTNYQKSNTQLQLKQQDLNTYCTIDENSNQNTNETHTYFIRIEKTNRSRTMEVNRLCIGVIIIYLVCELPAVGYQIIYLINHRNLIEIIKPITNTLVCLNSGINFFIYVFLGKRFRSQLKDMFKNLCIKCGLYQKFNNCTNINKKPRPTQYLNSMRNDINLLENDRRTPYLLKNTNLCTEQIQLKNLFRYYRHHKNTPNTTTTITITTNENNIGNNNDSGCHSNNNNNNNNNTNRYNNKHDYKNGRNNTNNDDDDDDDVDNNNDNCFSVSDVHKTQSVIIDA